MESNISRDHIALSVLEVILNKQMEKKKNAFSKEATLGFPDPEGVAELAYMYADAMIAEREKE